ncbi:MAG: hypothetical protein IJP63_00300 [Acholeplasmatales bacterium]|nr:hypothetical protein [Acholeplasmatales bacterium]
MSELFAVIDTETTWSDEVMSIGIVISNFDDYKIMDRIYYLFTPEYKTGGMFSYVLKETRGAKIEKDSRSKAMKKIKEYLLSKNIKYIFAYNASFDYRHLPELASFIWLDIMKIAAYRQYNDKLPKYADYCQTGRLRTGYGVESVYSYLSGKKYCEVHNALCDSEDELMIMKMLNKSLDDYYVGAINSNELISCYKQKNKKIVKNISTVISDECEEDVAFEKIDVSTLSVGDEILHINFGKGIIVDVSNKKFTAIKFGTMVKLLDVEYAAEKGYIRKK